MASLESLFTVIAGVGVAVVVGGLVYRDAMRLDVSRPATWAAFAGGTVMAGVIGWHFFPSVPIPGLLIVVLSGPVLYAFERDDTKRGDEPADPRVLPESGAGSNSITEMNRDRDPDRDDP